MLALHACFGLVHPKERRMKRKHETSGLQAFAKLGGKRLGHIYLREVSRNNLVHTVKDLQRQAALILVHPKQTMTSVPKWTVMCQAREADDNVYQVFLLSDKVVCLARRSVRQG